MEKLSNPNMALAYYMAALQKHLPLFMRFCDLNTNKLADVLGVTSQAIRNIIFNESKLTKTMFISMMTYFDYERRKPENKNALDKLFNAIFIPENYCWYQTSIESYIRIMNDSAKFLRKLIFGTGNNTDPVDQLLLGEAPVIQGRQVFQGSAEAIYYKRRELLNFLIDPLTVDSGVPFWLDAVINAVDFDEYYKTNIDQVLNDSRKNNDLSKEERMEKLDKTFMLIWRNVQEVKGLVDKNAEHYTVVDGEKPYNTNFFRPQAQ